MEPNGEATDQAAEAAVKVDLEQPARMAAFTVAVAVVGVAPPALKASSSSLIIRKRER
jgi:hypothetical protein